MPIMELENVRKSFGDIDVLKGISLTMERGEFLVLLGPSGCGKSTLLNMIAGLDGLTSGAIRINGCDVTGVAPKDRDIAMVFQSYALYPNMNVRKNILFGMKVRGVPQNKRKEALERVSQMLQIEHLLDRRPSQLSGGQRQRVAIGRALVREPSLFLLDEPLSNLDAKLRIDMRSEIKKLHQRLEASIIYVTHDQIEAMNLATMVAVMNEGHVIQFAPPQELYDRPQTVFVASFIGSSPMNLLSGRLEKRDGGIVFQTDPSLKPMEFPLSHYAFANGARDGQPAILGVRPESVGSPETHGRNGVSVDMDLEPTVIETNGHDLQVWFDFGKRDVGGRFTAFDGVRVGHATTARVDLSGVSVFDAETQMRM